MPSLQPVDFDPFAPQQAALPPVTTTPLEQQKGLQQVEHNPFASEIPSQLGYGTVSGIEQMVGGLRDVREAIAKFGKEKVESWLGFPIPQGVSAAVSSAANAAFPFTMGPTTQTITENREKLTGKFPEAKTTEGKYAHRVGEFIPGSLLPAKRMTDVAGNVVKYGVIPALPTEWVNQKTQGNPYQDLATAGTALVSGGVMSALSRPTSAAAAINRDLGGLSEAQLQPIVAQAENLIRDASQRGVNLTWAQAIEQVAPGSTNLPKLQRYIERTEQGSNALKPFYANQPQAMRNAVEDTVSQIAPINPAPSTIGPEASKAAQSTLDKINSLINKSTDDLYKASRGDLIPQQTYDILAQDASYAAALANIKKNPELSAQIAGLPDNSVGVIDRVRHYLQTAEKTGAISADPNERFLGALRGGIGNEAENVATRYSPNFAQAQAEQAAARQQYLNPVEQGPIGNVARAQDTESVLGSIFPKNPQAGSENEVSQVITALGRNNPTIPENIVAQHLRNNANTQMGQLQQGDNYFGGARFAKAVAGNPQAEANLNAATSALPNGANRASDVERLVEVLRATGKRLPEGSPTATDLTKADTLANNMRVRATSAGLSPQAWLNLGRDVYEPWKLGRVSDQVAKILMDPNSSEALIKAVRAKEASPGVAILLNALIGGR